MQFGNSRSSIWWMFFSLSNLFTCDNMTHPEGHCSTNNADQCFSPYSFFRPSTRPHSGFYAKTKISRVAYFAKRAYNIRRLPDLSTASAKWLIPLYGRPHLRNLALRFWHIEFTHCIHRKNADNEATVMTRQFPIWVTSMIKGILHNENQQCNAPLSVVHPYDIIKIAEP